MRLRDFENVLRRRSIAYRNKFSRAFTENNQVPTKKPMGFTVKNLVLGSEMASQRKFPGNINPTQQNLESDDDSDDLEEETITGYFNCKSEENLPMDFCKHTSLHGLKYIGERKQHFVERVFWSVAFVIGLIVAYYMISDVWRKYRNNSVIITFAPYETKIEEIPFPAITICNMNKVLKSKALQFMKDAKGPSRNEGTKSARENLYYLNHVCSSSKSFTKAFNYSAKRGKIDSLSLNAANKNEDNYDGGKEDLWQFFLEASPLCRDMILKCVWQDEVKNCSEFFSPIETDYGKCCTFNMVPPSVLHRINMTGVRDSNTTNKTQPWEWDGDSLLKKDHKADYPEFPRRQKIPGRSFGLSILLNPDLDEYFCTTSDSVGFRIVPHLPIDVPHISDLGSAIKPNSEVFINIRPEVTIADKDNIGDFSLSQRQCYFNAEHTLGYYNYYSSSNCIDECIANLTYEECNCRRHYQPGDDSKPLCGPKQFQCASSIKKKFVGNYKSHCKLCIPTCTEIAYHTETTYTKLQDSDLLWTDNKGQLAEWANKNVSIVHIYFGEGSTNAKLRKELYGIVDLIANFGGLMGLCLGFSGLSLVEVIYFLTIRAWFKTRRNQKMRMQQSNDRKRKSNIKKMTRTETIETELLSNSDITCIPQYIPPGQSLDKVNPRNKEVLWSLKKGRNGSDINEILYTVAFTRDNSTSTRNGGFSFETTSGTHM